MYCIPGSFPLLPKFRFIVAAVDQTVWSANDSVAEQLSMLSTIVNMGGTSVGYIQMPTFQAQTALQPLVKRRRIVEDTLLKSDVDFTNQLVLLFQKDSVRTNVDKRPSSQVCMIVVGGKQNKWLESAAIQSQVIPQVPVCSVSEMQGYDTDSKPGAAARAEQCLD